MRFSLVEEPKVTLYGAASTPKEVRIGDEVIHEWRYDSLAMPSCSRCPMRQRMERSPRVLEALLTRS